MATIAAVMSAGTTAHAGPLRPTPQGGDVYEISIDRRMAQQGSDGSKSSSTDRDTLIERVIGVRADGVELEYDLPSDATPEDRARTWQFPVRVLKGRDTPMRLLNGQQLEARVDDWLKRGGLTRSACGQWTFTWNAFRIECDPQSVIKTLELVDLDAVHLQDGAALREPMASGPVPLKRTAKATGSTLAAELTVDGAAVGRARAESDVVVAQLMKKPLSLEAALRDRGKDVVSGTISVTFDVGSDGRARRRVKVTRLETKRPSGKLETQTVTEIVERHLVSRPNS